MICKNHNNEIAIEKCSSCGRWFCDACVTIVDNKALCNHCQGKKTPILGEAFKNISSNFNKDKEEDFSKTYIDESQKPLYKEKGYFDKYRNRTISKQKTMVEETVKGIQAYNNTSKVSNLDFIKQNLSLRKRKINTKLAVSVILCVLPFVQIFGFILLITTIIDYANYSGELRSYNNNIRNK